MNNEFLISEGMRRAQEIGRKGEFVIGQMISHPSDRFVYELREIRDGLAVLGLTAKQSPTGKAVEKEFPLEEIYDPIIALEQALEARSEAIAAKLPGAIVIRLGR